jgi:type II secretory pathway predicted ATPase ExeA
VEWSHFGLNRQPFRPAVDPDSYFPAESHETALGAIADAFARRDPMVLLDGPPGTGKTLVARKWLEHLLPDVPRVVVPSACGESPAELHQAILFDLAKPYHGLSEQELRLAVTGHLLDAAMEGADPTVLVLDEAQHLARSVLEELRLLSNVETRQGVALFVVLVAQPVLRETLALPGLEPLAQRLAIRAALVPLTTEESADYIRHQVRAAGGEPERVLTDEAIPMLVGACRGVPRLLNRAALLALELAAANESTQADVEAVLEALERLGLSAAESDQLADPVLLPHPARSVGPAKSRRGKPGIASSSGEAAAVRPAKERQSRKRLA